MENTHICQTLITEHFSAAFKVFQHLRKLDRLTDVTVKVKGPKRLKCHKLVLAVGSPFFETAFKNEYTSEEISLEDFDPEPVSDLIDFFYTGKISIDLENVSSILDIATFLMVDLVLKYCDQVLIEGLKHSPKTTHTKKYSFSRDNNNRRVFFSK